MVKHGEMKQDFLNRSKVDSYDKKWNNKSDKRRTGKSRKKHLEMLG